MERQVLTDNAIEIPFEAKGVHVFLDRRIFDGKLYWDLRKYYETDSLPKQEYEGAYTPSIKGISLEPETWIAVIKAIEPYLEGRG